MGAKKQTTDEIFDSIDRRLIELERIIAELQVKVEAGLAKSNEAVMEGLLQALEHAGWGDGEEVER